MPQSCNCSSQIGAPTAYGDALPQPALDVLRAAFHLRIVRRRLFAASTMFRRRHEPRRQPAGLQASRSGFTHSISAGIAARCFPQPAHDLFSLRHPRAVNVIHARPDFVRILEVHKSTEQLHIGARGLDRDHVGIQGGDRLDDVVELRVAHVGVDLRLVAHATGGEAEGIDGPFKYSGRSTLR